MSKFIKLTNVYNAKILIRKSDISRVSRDGTIGYIYNRKDALIAKVKESADEIHILLDGDSNELPIETDYTINSTR